MATPTVGFIGLGSQGGPMARRIVEAGYPLVLWARRKESLEPYADTAAQTVDLIAELGAACDLVGVCVVNDAGVQAVCDDLIPAMKPGSRIAIHSTIHPDTCVALAQLCAKAGIGLIDAPVSGGGQGAAAGTLTVMCGGSPEDFAAAKPVFESFGKLIVLLGPVGAGQRAKLVNNALMAANMGLAHASLNAGEALGVDRAALVELIKVSSGRSFAFDVYARLPQPLEVWPGAPLLLKDVHLLEACSPHEPSIKALAEAADIFLSAMGS
jgi:3-hydroxyisobutyrate dehydrogenase